MTDTKTKAKAQNELDDRRAVYGDIGFILFSNYDIARNELLRYDIFSQVKKNKKNNKTGRKWAQFCTDAGENVRTVDRFLSTDRAVLESKVEKAFKKLLPMEDNQIGGDDD